MFRRFAPALVIFICFVLDTTLIPIVYSGVYAVPLTIVAVFLIGMLLGRMSGLLYGTIGGLLIDITTGTLGMMAFYFMAVGFLIGLILNDPHERPMATRRHVRRRRIRRAAWVFVLYALGELALLAIQFFHQDAMEWIYFVNIAVRSLICTALTVILRPLMKPLLLGDRRGAARTRGKEAKSY